MAILGALINTLKQIGLALTAHTPWIRQITPLRYAFLPLLGEDTDRVGVSAYSVADA